MKQQTLREDAYSREAETCRKRPRETPECVKAHSFSQNFSPLRIVGCQKSGGTQVGKKFIEAFNDIFSTCWICDGSSGGDDGGGTGRTRRGDVKRKVAITLKNQGEIKNKRLSHYAESRPGKTGRLFCVVGLERRKIFLVEN